MNWLATELQHPSCLPPHPSPSAITYLFIIYCQAGSLIESRICCSVWTACQQGPGTLSSSLCWNCMFVPPCLTFFAGAGNWNSASCLHGNPFVHLAPCTTSTAFTCFPAVPGTPKSHPVPLKKKKKTKVGCDCGGLCLQSRLLLDRGRRLSLLSNVQASLGYRVSVRLPFPSSPNQVPKVNFIIL